ncbi:MAG: glycosyltransferase [Lachnospiraceae bacterium]|nr:glycosyltransferase [Lachnospiraceae bacterium]
MEDLKKFIKKTILFIKRRGFRGILEKLHVVSVKNELLKHYEYIMNETKIPLNEKAYLKHKDDEVKILNWIIPEMGIGSGGHINIFRFISNLENMGFHSRIYLFLSPTFKDNESVRAFLKEHFQILDSRVESFWDVSEAKYAHATIATAWQTAYFVRNFDNTTSKFYFVQDYEPYFYAKGSEYELAENTYKFGLRGITAGDWLKDLLKEKYQMKTKSFGFSYDKDLYTPQKKKGKIKRVFFYARPVTPRRDFEIGLLALNALCKRMPDVEVIFAGWDVSDYVIPFKHQNLGVVKLENLSKLYAQCDLCLVISNTNLSLLPLEVMASNSVAVCSKGANSRWLVNEENAVLVDYDPVDIVNTLEYYLKNPEKLEDIRKKGLEFAQSTSWITEAEKVRSALVKGISEDDK